MLDTGATWNMFNSKIGETHSLDEMIWDDKNIFQYSSLQVNGKDLGPIIFHRAPINIPIQIDAILGMEFFEDNIVFLDFSKRTAYFYKKPIHRS